MNSLLIFNANVFFSPVLHHTVNIQWLRSESPIGQPWSYLHPSAKDGPLIYLPSKTAHNGKMK